MRTKGSRKYRRRTRIRGRIPLALARLVPKGKQDCGAHEWYRSEGETWRCYHCQVGVARSHSRPQ
jgi:hypothetical protein